MKLHHIISYAVVLVFGYWFEYKVLDGNIPIWLFVVLTLALGHHWLHLYDNDKALVEAQDKVKPIVWIWAWVLCFGIIGIVCNIVNKEWWMLVLFLVITIISIIVLCHHFDEPEEIDDDTRIGESK